MTASEDAKKAGLHNLKEVVDMTDTRFQTLNGWHKRKPKLFAAVVAGCYALKNAGKESSKSTTEN